MLDGGGASWRPGTVVGGYVLEERVGEGGFGEVWRAREVELDRVVAIKRLHPTGIDDELRERFRKEARMTAQLKHRNIPTLYTSNEDGPYIVSEFVDGASLDTFVRHAPLAPEKAVDVLVQAADALEHAHERGIVHRDIKPANIMLRASDECVYVVDFGIGVVVDVKRTRLTVAGCVVGSLAYMAPERMEFAGGPGTEPHAGLDVYALACVLYECLTGRRAFNGPCHAAERPRPGDVDAALCPFDGVVVRGLAVRPEDRISSAAEFRGQLLAALSTWERSAEDTTAPASTPATPAQLTPPDTASDRERSPGRSRSFVVAAVAGLGGCGIVLVSDLGLALDLVVIAGSWAAGLGGGFWWWRSRRNRDA